MSTSGSRTSISRRRLLSAGATLSAGMLAMSAKPNVVIMEETDDDDLEWAPLSPETIEGIQSMIQAQGTVSNGVLSIEIDRDDLSNVKKGNVHIKPAFQINGNIFFQGFSDGRAAMNGDMALKPTEIDPFIDRLLVHHLVFQAEHQHFYDLSPMVWFIHFRKFGDPIEIAKGVKAALDV